MLQLTRAAFVCTESEEELVAMRRSFERDHAIRLPHLFDPALVAFVQQYVREARFADRDDGVAREACMEDNAILAMLYLITNDDRLFDAIRAITGCAPIGAFLGRVYRMRAAAGHYDQWHSDVIDGRLIGMSVNLTEGDFAGGVFELRRNISDVPHWSAANTRAGDAILFEISDDLLHRVSAVEGSIPRVAYAGWFQSGPVFTTLLEDARVRAEGENTLKYTDPTHGRPVSG